MNGADLLVRLLKAQGVPFITTLSGNGLNPFYVACKHADMRFIDFRNEQAAAYAAEVDARLTRRLGVCAVSSGVAHANAFAGVVNAYYDGAPMLLITGASDNVRRDQWNFQDIDQVAMAAPLCKYAKYVDQAERIPFYLREACRYALAGRPGPVHLTVPLDVLNAEVGEIDERNLRPAALYVEPRAAADLAAVTAAADLLAAAKRPLLIAGGGVFYAQAGNALDHLASEMHIPVQTPIWDRGVVTQPTTYYCGVIGAASGGPSLLADTDLVLIVGAHVDYRLGHMEAPAIGADVKVVRVDVDPTYLRQGIEPDVAIHADPRSALAALASELAAREVEPYAAWCEEAARRYHAFRARWAKGAPAGAPPMTSHHVVEALRPLLDEDVVFLVDGGNIGQWVHQVLGDRYPANWVTCGASGVVGWGLGGAIGAKLEYPDKPVVLLSGDGSFGFTIAELETAVRHRTPIIAIVADDQWWGIVASGQRRQYGEEGVLGCKLGPARYDVIAEGFGCLGLRAERPESILPAVRQAIASGCPTVIHVPILHQGPSD
ncbi:MAG: thiamine pyrophosphate-binding protein [Chloroflexota bacterium]